VTAGFDDPAEERGEIAEGDAHMLARTGDPAIRRSRRDLDLDFDQERDSQRRPAGRVQAHSPGSEPARSCCRGIRRYRPR
jgi:hypothetical protein